MPTLVAERAVSSSSDADTTEISETPNGQIGVVHYANPQDRLAERCEPNAGSQLTRESQDFACSLSRVSPWLVGMTSVPPGTNG
ncbi:MAG TPA: hypothetical protein VIJ41_13455, partial [Candidatus Nanopelagicales bacterium]